MSSNSSSQIEAMYTLSNAIDIDPSSDEAKFIIPDNADKSIYEIMLECALSEEDEFKLMQHIKTKKRGSVNNFKI